MLPDLISTRQRMQADAFTPLQAMEASLQHASSVACQGAFVRTTFDEAHEQAACLGRQPGGVTAWPLAGLAFSVKDLFDVEGQVTAAGSTVLADAPVMIAEDGGCCGDEATAGVAVQEEAPAPCCA